MNTLDLISYEWRTGRFQILLSHSSSDIQEIIFNHCCEAFDNPMHINDSKSNRGLMTAILEAHGYQPVFLHPLPKDVLRERKSKNRARESS